MASFLSFLLGEKKKTASVAKERLQIILAHERSGRNASEPDYLPALQRELGLPIAPEIPLVAFIGRMAEQKGIDLLAATARDWVQSQNVQWVILGTGEANYQDQFVLLSQRFSHNIDTRLQLSNALHYRI